MKKLIISLFILFLTLHSNVFCHTLEKFPIGQKPSLVVSTKKIDIPDYPNAFNPSITKFDDRYLLTFRVLGKKLNISYIGVVLLDEDLEIISEPEILSPRDDKNKIPSQAEDARIFPCNGKIYLMYNDNDTEVYDSGDVRRDIYVAELVYKYGHFSINNPVRLRHQDYYNSENVQKNWVPFEWDNMLLIGYSINPHEVIYPDLDSGLCISLEKTKASIKWGFGTLRGGTPAYLFEDEYLAFFHSSIVTASEASNHKPMRHYFMGAYTFKPDPPFLITKMTEQPLMHPSFYTKSEKKLRAVFPGGYAISGPKIYVAYGKDDHEVWIATIDIEKLKTALKPISKVQNK